MEFNEFVEKRHWYSSFWADVVWVLLGVLALLFIFGTQYATGEFGFSAKIEKRQIKTNESAVVVFSQPVAFKAVEKNFEISPNMEVGFAWSDNYQKLGISPAGSFEAGQTYAIKIDPQTSFSLSNVMGKKAEPLVLSFQVDRPPNVASMNPFSGDPNVKISSEIKISFDKSTNGYDVNFIVEPFSNFSVTFDDARKNFTIAPKGNLDFARDYAISVKLAPSSAKLASAEMSEIYRANFKTEPSPPPPPDPIEEVVLPEDKAAGIIADSQVASPEAKITEGKYIDINLAKQQLSIFENGERLGTYKVSTGKKGMATPTGTFKVMSKAGRAYSKKYNLYMPFWMQFTGAGHGIHELPEWKNGYKEGANHLGTPVSHGCVRLGVGPAAKVYGWSEVGTPIVIHY
jgi:lipoprotein-anchoring transpeptidase ErfK/SrfK